MKNIPHPKVNPYEADRKKPRMPGYDYGRPGTYFVTFCTQDRTCYFGDIVDGKMHYSQQGVIAEVCAKMLPLLSPGIEVLAYVIMPDHVHLLLKINSVEECEVPELGTDTCEQGHRQCPSKIKTLSSIIGNYKASVSRHCHRTGFPLMWQGSFYDRIVGDQEEKLAYVTYINNNVVNWPYASTNIAPGLMM